MCKSAVARHPVSLVPGRGARCAHRRALCCVIRHSVLSVLAAASDFRPCTPTQMLGGSMVKVGARRLVVVIRNVSARNSIQAESSPPHCSVPPLCWQGGRCRAAGGWSRGHSPTTRVWRSPPWCVKISVCILKHREKTNFTVSDTLLPEICAFSVPCQG